MYSLTFGKKNRVTEEIRLAVHSTAWFVCGLSEIEEVRAVTDVLREMVTFEELERASADCELLQRIARGFRYLTKPYGDLTGSA